MIKTINVKFSNYGRGGMSNVKYKSETSEIHF